MSSRKFSFVDLRGLKGRGLVWESTNAGAGVLQLTAVAWEEMVQIQLASYKFLKGQPLDSKNWLPLSETASGSYRLGHLEFRARDSESYLHPT